MGTLLTADRLFDGRSVVEKGAVLIEGEEIRFAGPASRAPTNGAETRDFGDATLCPGFIDLHIHNLGATTYSVHSILLVDERMGALRQVPRLKSLLQAGYTSARDCGSGPGVPLRDALAEGAFPGPRLYVARAGISQTGGHIDVHSVPSSWLCRAGIFRLADGADDCRKAVREQFREGADFIKICTTGGVLSERDHSQQEQYCDEEVEAIVDEAHRMGMKVASHAQGTAGILRALRAGVDTIEHGFYLDDQGIELCLKQGTVVVPTLAIQNQIIEHGPEFGVPDASIEKCKAAREAHHASLEKARKAGVRIGTGSDFMGGPNNLFSDCVLEMELLVQQGFSPVEALTAATANGGHALTKRGLDEHEQLGPKWFDRVGELREGMLADVTVLKGDATTDISAVRNVLAVYRGGETV